MELNSTNNMYLTFKHKIFDDESKSEIVCTLMIEAPWAKLCVLVKVVVNKLNQYLC